MFQHLCSNFFRPIEQPNFKFKVSFNCYSVFLSKSLVFEFQEQQSLIYLKTNQIGTQSENDSVDN